MLLIVGRKRFWYKTGDELKKGIAERRILSTEPPKKMYDKFHVEQKEIQGHHYYEISQKNGRNQPHILYLHGGAYVHRITKYHWDFLYRLAQTLSCSLTVPLYPLAPEHTYKETVDMVTQLYREQLGQKDSIIFMGDSAGGGLALALAQRLKINGEALPSQLILIAPWLDMTLSNPEIDILQKGDYFVAKPGLMEVAKWYSGGEDLRCYLLSPMYGELKGLPQITLFVGTKDSLVADSRKFVAMAAEQGIEIDYIEQQNMVHVYPIFTFPEAQVAFHQIIERIQR
ncbi:alpha/beta hydrolase [Lysinibacillus sp. 54212]|uniref:alpha/beta hydrolase n=1 Tax=Lysinibacillus sp. 54212 TaxID=3119829 RepID=UPI002FC9F95F